MKILFIHQNMPGQYKHIAPLMAADPNNEVVFITRPTKVTIPNVIKIEFDVKRDSQPDIHKYLIPYERAIFAGQEVWRACNKLKQAGFIPDVVVAHPGWGDALFVKDIFYDTPLLNFQEFYYRSFGSDMHFNPNDPIVPNELARVRIKNSNNIMNLDACDWGICPTHWQAKQLPQGFMHKISVLHDGVDANVAAPAKGRTITLANGKTLKQGDEIVTHVARNFEPYRGFPTIMRAFDIILKERPNCEILVVGNDGVSYGRGLENGKTYKQQMLEELPDLDMNRLHFLGTVPHADMIQVMQISSAHIYMTYPFVLSWSMLEAMSTGCLMIASDTPPVTEVIEDGKNGLLVDFFSHEGLAKRIHEALDKQEELQPIREAARQTVLDKYALDKLLPLHVKLITDLAKGQLPPQAAEEINQLYV